MFWWLKIIFLIGRWLLYNEDNFKPKVFSSMNLEEEKAKVRKEIEPITKFVDELRLDNSIFAEGAVSNDINLGV